MENTKENKQKNVKDAFLDGVKSFSPSDTSLTHGEFKEENPGLDVKGIHNSSKGWFVDGPDSDVKFKTHVECALFRKKAIDLGMTYSQACEIWREDKRRKDLLKGMKNG